MRIPTQWRGDYGASSVEYGILVSMIAALIVLVVTTLGQDTSSLFNSLVSAF